MHTQPRRTRWDVPPPVERRDEPDDVDSQLQHAIDIIHRYQSRLQSHPQLSASLRRYVDAEAEERDLLQYNWGNLQTNTPFSQSTTSRPSTPQQRMPPYTPLASAHSAPCRSTDEGKNRRFASSFTSRFSLNATRHYPAQQQIITEHHYPHTPHSITSSVSPNIPAPLQNARNRTSTRVPSALDWDSSTLPDTLDDPPTEPYTPLEPTSQALLDPVQTAPASDHHRHRSTTTQAQHIANHGSTAIPNTSDLSTGYSRIPVDHSSTQVPHSFDPAPSSRHDSFHSTSAQYRHQRVHSSPALLDPLDGSSTEDYASLEPISAPSHDSLRSTSAQRRLPVAYTSSSTREQADASQGAPFVSRRTTPATLLNPPDPSSAEPPNQLHGTSIPNPPPFNPNDATLPDSLDHRPVQARHPRHHTSGRVLAPPPHGPAALPNPGHHTSSALLDPLQTPPASLLSSIPPPSPVLSDPPQHTSSPVLDPMQTPPFIEDSEYSDDIYHRTLDNIRFSPSSSDSESISPSLIPERSVVERGDESSEDGSEDPNLEAVEDTLKSCLADTSSISYPTEPIATTNQALTTGDHTRVSLCLKGLATITDEELNQVLQGEISRPESVVRKQKWVLSMYEQFCRRTGKQELLPFNIPHVCGFIRFLAVFCHYALTGIEQVIVPTIRRINTTNNKDSDTALAHALRDTISQLKHHPKVKKSGPGKPPLCTFDVEELIKRIPDSLSSKELEASLFLFALHTGSRALTCENVRLGDLEQLEVDNTSGLACLVVILRVTKGNPNYNHPVKLEGYLTRPHPLDAVYHLNRYLQQRFGLSLTDLVTETPHPYASKPLWPLARDAMRERLKKRLVQAGFPSDRWAFHSLRSGFICSALLTAGADQGRRTSVLETTAVVAGWAVYGRAQRAYIKTVAQRSIVASRLLGLGIGLDASDTTQQTSSNSTVAAVGFVKQNFTSETFHGFKFKDPTFHIGMFQKELRRKFNAPFLEHTLSEEQSRLYAQNSYISLLVKLGREQLVREGNKNPTYRECRRTGSSIIRLRLLDKTQSIDDTAQYLLQQLPSIGVDPTKLPTRKSPSRKRASPQTVPPRPTLLGRTGRISRIRLPWREDEDKILIDAHIHYIPLADVIHKLPDRTLADAVSRRRYLISTQFEKIQRAALMQQTAQAFNPTDN